MLRSHLTIILFLIIAAIAVAAAFLTYVFFRKPEVTGEYALPETKALSDSATVRTEDTSVAEIEITDSKGAVVLVRTHGYGSTIFTVTDGSNVYAYLLNVKRSMGGTVIEILPADM
ncbi:MAG: hypothetical protein J5744_05025 [Oscillospiraceae bacterium]|nr:hypothetical protein [Oscillospiraceae bacterium]